MGSRHWRASLHTGTGSSGKETEPSGSHRPRTYLDPSTTWRVLAHLNRASEPTFKGATLTAKNPECGSISRQLDTVQSGHWTGSGYAPPSWHLSL